MPDEPLTPEAQEAVASLLKAYAGMAGAPKVYLPGETPPVPIIKAPFLDLAKKATLSGKAASQIFDPLVPGAPKPDPYTTYVTVYTDGCCSKDGRAAGVMVALIQKRLYVSVALGAKQTTTRAEILGAKLATLFFKSCMQAKKSNETLDLRCWTDNQSVQKTMATWLLNWDLSGYVLKGGGEVKNQDLWKEIASHKVWMQAEWNWVKGHSGVLGNELCDFLADVSREWLPGPGYDTPQALATAQNLASGALVNEAKKFLSVHGIGEDQIDDVVLFKWEKYV